MHYDIENVRNKLFEIYKSQLAEVKSEKIKEISDIEFTTLNSVEYIKFVVLVETEYDFEFLPEDLKMGRFSCFEDIVEYVYKRITEDK